MIAATLYKSLVAHMKAKEKKPRNKNGVTCMSIASSTYQDKNNIPVRPPRKKRSTTSSIISESDNLNVCNVVNYVDQLVDEGVSDVRHPAFAHGAQQTTQEEHQDEEGTQSSSQPEGSRLGCHNALRGAHQTLTRQRQKRKRQHVQRNSRN